MDDLLSAMSRWLDSKVALQKAIDSTEYDRDWYCHREIGTEHQDRLDVESALNGIIDGRVQDKLIELGLMKKPEPKNDSDE